MNVGREELMQATGGMLIAVSEARNACKGEPDVTERIRKAMRACRGHWMETNEENQFRAAVAAAALESEGEEKDRVERSAKALGRLSAVMNALQAGVPVDLEAMIAEPKDDDLIPLSGLWHESR
jgi:hypothetical protein